MGEQAEGVPLVPVQVNTVEQELVLILVWSKGYRQYLLTDKREVAQGRAARKHLPRFKRGKSGVPVQRLSIEYAFKGESALECKLAHPRKADRGWGAQASKPAFSCSPY